MSFLVMQFLLIATVAILGVVAGWTLRGVDQRANPAPAVPPTAAPAVPPENTAEMARQTEQLIGRLHDLTERVAANVGEHQTRVEAINEELAASDAPAADAVMRAVDKLVEANQRMQQQLATAQDKLREQAEQIESQAAEARTDALTELPNRRAFDNEIYRRIEEARESGLAMCVTMVDVDHFKRVNDNYGHQAGDEVLRRVATALAEAAPSHDLVARYGGEEFAIVHPGTPIDSATGIADNCRRLIEALRISAAGQQLRITASFGSAQLLPNEDADSVIHRADAALYAAKAAGRNQTFMHDGRDAQAVEISKSATGPEQPAQAAILPNRAAFATVLGNRIAEWRRGGEQPSVLFIQVDKYHELVARHGSSVGTMILSALSQFLVAATRASDVIARADGPAFAIMMPGISLENMALVAERLRQTVAHCSLADESGDIRFSISLGGALAARGDTAQNTIDRVRRAVGAANKAGGNHAYMLDDTTFIPAEQLCQAVGDASRATPAGSTSALG